MTDHPARNRKALLLATGKIRRPFFNFRVVCLRQPFDKFSRLRHPSRPLHRRQISIRIALLQIFGNRAGKKRRALQHIPDRLAQIRFGDGTNIMPADFNDSGIRIKQPRNQLCQGRFTATGRPDDANHFPWLNRKIDISNRRLFITWIRKSHIVKLNGSV